MISIRDYVHKFIIDYEHDFIMELADWRVYRHRQLLKSLGFINSIIEAIDWQVFQSGSKLGLHTTSASYSNFNCS